jgi:hypothetical protein
MRSELIAAATAIALGLVMPTTGHRGIWDGGVGSFQAGEWPPGGDFGSGHFRRLHGGFGGYRGFPGYFGYGGYGLGLGGHGLGAYDGYVGH